MEAVKEARKSSGSDADLGLDLDLVLARTFSKWNGHDSEALAIYDRLAEVRHALAPATRLPAPSRVGVCQVDQSRYRQDCFFLVLQGSMRRACWEAWHLTSEKMEAVDAEFCSSTTQTSSDDFRVPLAKGLLMNGCASLALVRLLSVACRC